jgi:putative membrane protein
MDGLLSGHMSVIAWIINLLITVLFLAGFVALCIWFFKRLTKGDSANRQTPMEIASARYARGDINKEQFEQIKKDLG